MTSNAYMRQLTMPPLLQVMASRIFGAKLLSKQIGDLSQILDK